MRIGYAQIDVVHGNRQENWRRIGDALDGIRCDLLVLPELFESGYAFENREQAASLGEPLKCSGSVVFLQALAGKLGGAVTGTVVERCGDCLFDTALLVDERGLLGAQRKIHLTEYEMRFFAPGTEIAVVALRSGVRIGMMTCFDCWFPEYSAMLKAQQVDIICNSCCFGGTVTPRILPIRALETQSFVISCNRVGTELFQGEEEGYCGQSQLITPDGEALSKAGDKEALTVMEVDLETVGQPRFGSLLCQDFAAEHGRYSVSLRES